MLPEPPLRVPREFRVKREPHLARTMHPAQVLLIGFAVLIAIGTLLLMLPPATAAGRSTDLLTALFTATSAVCVTGLVVVDTGVHWSPLGQVIIALLIQVGGLGFMTSSTLLLLLLVRGRTSLRDRVTVQETLGAPELGSVVHLVRNVTLFALAVEAVGFVILAIRFAVGGEAEAAGSNALWWAVFHSISAFNNAGFDLTGGFTSLVAFRTEPLVLGTFGLMILFGAIGYAIVADILAKRRWARVALETRIVVLTTVAMLVVGAALIGAIEWGNPRTLAALEPPDRLINVAFEAISVRTAGFSTLDHAAFDEASLFVGIALMFIGGASGSAAGGIKVNTFSVLLVAIISTVRGRPSAEAFGRRIAHIVVYRALAVALLAIAFVFVIGLLLTLTTTVRFAPALFEAVSAFGTVGASTGITPTVSDPARLVLVVAMFAGRLGPLTVVLALAARARPVAYRPAVESVRIG